MAELDYEFDAESIEPSAPMEVIPPGDYLAMVVASDLKPTKAGTGKLLALEFSIVGGVYANRRLWSNLNLINANPQAQEIAQRDFSALCRAAGIARIRDSEQLHGIPITVVVKVRPAGRDKQGVDREARNEIGGYKPASGARAVTPPRQAPRQASAQPANQAQPTSQPTSDAPPKKAMPWDRKR